MNPVGWWVGAVYLCIVAQAICLFVLIRRLPTFGQYGEVTKQARELTEVLLATHKSNMLLHDTVQYEIDEIRQLRQLGLLNSELAAERAANFVYDPSSDRSRASA